MVSVLLPPLKIIYIAYDFLITYRFKLINIKVAKILKRISEWPGFFYFNVRGRNLSAFALIVLLFTEDRGEMMHSLF